MAKGKQTCKILKEIRKQIELFFGFLFRFVSKKALPLPPQKQSPVGATDIKQAT